MKRWHHISEKTIALADSRAAVLGELSRELAPGGWIVSPLQWRPDRVQDGVRVLIDVPDEPTGLLA